MGSLQQILSKLDICEATAARSYGQSEMPALSPVKKNIVNRSFYSCYPYLWRHSSALMYYYCLQYYLIMLAVAKNTNVFHIILFQVLTPASHTANPKVTTLRKALLY